jgi:hypothetical protein
MGEQLSKAYDPKTTEKLANEIWFSGSYFHAEPPPDGSKSPRKSYTIVIPPPNVTAPLHVGHALNNTLQDVLIRFRRMQKYNTLWMPGTDHAGIATQTVVEKRILSEEGKRRTDFARGRKANDERILHVRNLSAACRPGKTNTKRELSNNCGQWAVPVIGTGPGSRWMRFVRKPCVPLFLSSLRMG